jgi:hypothetical protein
MSELKKKLNRENEAAKKAALKESKLKRVVVWVYPEDVKTVKAFDKQSELWGKPRGRKPKNPEGGE